MKILGINGLGRIGKLSLWVHAAKRHFDEIVVNTGRSVGRSFYDLVDYVCTDSSYGSLDSFINGFSGAEVVRDIDPDNHTFVMNGVKVTILMTERNPANIGWKKYGVKLVLDTTGCFRDPDAPADSPRGSLQGHMASGAEKVILSAPFKVKGEMPEHAITTVMGINDRDYDADKHTLISNASCTTNCLAHLIKPLLDHFGENKIMTASMQTIHAATGSQQVLDRMPPAGSGDLRKNRSVMNNIILTSTGAAKALSLVIPEMKKIGFIANSVRIPTSTGSLIILVINLKDQGSVGEIDRDLINDIYRRAEANDSEGNLVFSEKQNVSSDIIGSRRAAAVVEGSETHTRSACVEINLEKQPHIYEKLKYAVEDTELKIPVTQTVIYGWYDNELSSYTQMLYDRTVSIAESMK